MSNKSDRRRASAEAYIENSFPLYSNISCEKLVDTNALMNAEKTLLSNEILILKGQDRKLAEDKLSALARQRKKLDELYVFKRCRELESLDIQKTNLDTLSAIRDKSASMGTQLLDGKSLAIIGAIVVVALGGAYALRKRG